MIIRININKDQIIKDIRFKGSYTTSQENDTTRYTTESQLCLVTTEKQELWKHRTPDANTSGGKLRTVEIIGDQCSLEIVTKNNVDGFCIRTMDPVVELVYDGNTLIGIILSEK